MDDHFNPFTFVISLVIHGIILGVILAIAWPVKQLLTAGGVKLWNGATSSLRPVREVSAKREQV